MLNILIYFITGGLVTTTIVLLEESNFFLLSGFATIMPVFTLIAYLFIGQSRGGVALSEHAKFVLVGTMVAWVPYMLAIMWLAPHLSANRTIAAALAVFFVLAVVFLLLTKQYGWFQ